MVRHLYYFVGKFFEVKLRRLLLRSAQIKKRYLTATQHFSTLKKLALIYRPVPSADEEIFTKAMRHWLR
jgi:hypothetical protein